MPPLWRRVCAAGRGASISGNRYGSDSSVTNSPVLVLAGHCAVRFWLLEVLVYGISRDSDGIMSLENGPVWGQQD